MRKDRGLDGVGEGEGEGAPYQQNQDLQRIKTSICRFFPTKSRLTAY